MSDQPETKTRIHIIFVEMLFALAIGQIAISFSSLIDYQLASKQTFSAVIPAYSHLFLAFVVISTSWVGWRNSRFCGTQIEDVFSWNFVELFTDIALVIMYFTLARAVEIPDSSNDILVPNASFEAITVLVIITTYLIWDMIYSLTNRTKRNEKLTQRLWVSVFCTIISFVLVSYGIGRSGTIAAVLFADLCLIALILTFRAMKRYDLSKHNKKSWGLILSMLILVVIFSVASTRL